MSTISEIDIRDWDKIDIPHINQVLDDVDFENMQYPQWHLAKELEVFIRQVEEIKNRQMKEATKNVAALFKPKE